MKRKKTQHRKNGNKDRKNSVVKRVMFRPVNFTLAGSACPILSVCAFTTVVEPFGLLCLHPRLALPSEPTFLLCVWLQAANKFKMLDPFEERLNNFKKPWENRKQKQQQISEQRAGRSKFSFSRVEGLCCLLRALACFVMSRVHASGSLRRYLVVPRSSAGVLSSVSLKDGPVAATPTAVSFSTGAPMPSPQVLPQVSRTGLVAVAQRGKRVSSLRSSCVCEPRKLLLITFNSGLWPPCSTCPVVSDVLYHKRTKKASAGYKYTTSYRLPLVPGRCTTGMFMVQGLRSAGG